MITCRTVSAPRLGLRDFRNPAPGSRRFGLSAIGLVGTLLLHVLLGLPFVLDLSLPAPRLPDRSGAGASAVASQEEPVMTVVFINEVSPTEPLKALEPEKLASRGLAAK